MRHIDGDISNKILRLCNGLCYYFDQEGIYRCVSIKEAKKMHLKLDSLTMEEWFPYHLEKNKIYHGYIELISNNGNLVRKVIRQLEVGDTIEVFEEYLENTVIQRHVKPSGIDRFITKIEEPIFACATENPNQDTFDFVYVYVNIISKWEENRLTYIQKHKKEILKMVLDKIEASKRFQKFGIPINFLKASHVVLKRNSVLEFVFELKI